MKLNYSIVAQTPLFTGSDENTGTLRTLRREKRLLKQPVKFVSSFKSKVERTKKLMDVVYTIYNNIDVKLKSAHYGFYEAYSNKLKAAYASQSKKDFLNKVIEGCGIGVLSDGSAQIVRRALDMFSDIEFLEVIREEHQYLMILLREYVNYYRTAESKDFTAGGPDCFPSFNLEEIHFEKHFEDVPYFGGNSIRGYLRRLTMYDFCKLAGVKKLNKDTYHQLFTGGNITESTGFEDIEKRETYIAMCPPIGLFGSAIGNMTIEGEMKVVGARLRCIENGTGEVSFWQLIDTNFGTRLDSSKKEKEIEIVNNMDEKSQMIYQYENFVTGSTFDSSFVLTTDNELLISAFWRMLRLWKENPVIGGNSARDSGMIELDYTIPENADKLYLDYISENSEKIKAYFETLGYAEKAETEAKPKAKSKK